MGEAWNYVLLAFTVTVATPCQGFETQHGLISSCFFCYPCLWIVQHGTCVNFSTWEKSSSSWENNSWCQKISWHFSFFSVARYLNLSGYFNLIVEFWLRFFLASSLNFKLNKSEYFLFSGSEFYFPRTRGCAVAIRKPTSFSFFLATLDSLCAWKVYHVRRILILVVFSHFFAWISERNQQVACFPDENCQKYAAFLRKSEIRENFAESISGAQHVVDLWVHLAPPYVLGLGDVTPRRSDVRPGCGNILRSYAHMRRRTMFSPRPVLRDHGLSPLNLGHI
jgi:hypothetical protein